jgi:hypothetical protein
MRTTTEKKAAMCDWMIKKIQSHYAARVIDTNSVDDMIGVAEMFKRDAEFIKLYNKIERNGTSYTLEETDQS